jgi:hypothetical protein
LAARTASLPRYPRRRTPRPMDKPSESPDQGNFATAHEQAVAAGVGGRGDRMELADS